MITRNVYRRTVGRTDERRRVPRRKKSSSGLRPEELMISKKGPEIYIVVIRPCLNPQVV